MKYSRDLLGKKQITLNMIANIVSFFANVIISFVLTPFLINTLGKDIYSFYPMANTMVTYMSVLTTSMNSIASRYITIAYAQERDDDVNKYYSSVIASNIILCLLLSIPMVLVIVFLDKIFNIPINALASIKGLFSLVFASTLVNILASVFGIATFVKNRIDLRSLLELIISGLRVLLFFTFYLLFSPSIIYVGVIAVIVATINVGFQFRFTKILLPNIILSPAFFSYRHIKEIFISSIWNAINSFGNILLAGMTLVMSNIMFGSEASGSYSIVQTVPNFINGIISMLVSVFFPVITHRYAQSDKDRLIKDIQLSQCLVGIFGCAVICVFSGLSVSFFSLWVPEENSSFLATLSLIVILPHILISCAWPLTNLNIVMNKVKIPAIFTLLAGILNIVLGYGFYRFTNYDFKIFAVISTILQFFWIGLFIPIYACANLKVKGRIFYSTIVRGIFSSGIVYFCTKYIGDKIAIDSWEEYIFYGIILGISALIFNAVIILGPQKAITLLNNFKARFSKSS